MSRATKPTPAEPLDPWGMFMDELMSGGEVQPAEPPASPEPAAEATSKKPGRPKRAR